MKQIHLSWLLMAAAVITACEKERIEAEPIVEEAIENATDNAPYVYSVKATISSEEGTRTDYDASGKFSWTAGDKISVLFHNDEGNKFFTLSTEAGGETATFTGTIDAGYTIGAKDGTAEDAKIWALYPASENHQYEDGSMPSFYVQPSVDFTETGFSANIPMYDLLTEEGAFSFKNLASTYKFIVKDLDPAVEKVKFVVYNQLTYGLSGLWPIEKNGSDIFIDYNWASPGSENSTLTFISPVTDGKAVFYVPTRYWGKFQPVITISDANRDLVLKTFTAGVAIQPTSFTDVQQISLSVPTEIPTFAIDIDGDMSDWDDVETGFTNDSNNYRVFKATYDKYNIYLYTKRVTVSGQQYIYYDFDLDNDSTTGANENSRVGLEAYMALKLYNGDSIVLNPKADPSYPDNNVYAGIVCKGTVGVDFTETELSIPRSNLGIKNGDVIKIYSWGNKSADGVASHPLTLSINN